MTILKERKKFFQSSVICKNSSYRTLKIASELSVGSNREVILGCVWVITLLRLTLFVLFFGRASRNHTAICPFCVLWPPLPSNINLPESSLSINVMDCSTNVVQRISIPVTPPLKRSFDRLNSARYS